MRRVTAALALALLAAPLAAEAQRPKKISRIGYLRLVGMSGLRAHHYEAFWQGLRELGYVDYKDFIVERRLAHDAAQLAKHAAELVRLKVDLIVADSTAAALAAKNATMAVPIVLIVGDPVGSGLAASLARPGGNITGMATLSPELSAKGLELLKEAAPKVSRVAILWDPADPDTAPNLKTTQVAARAGGVKLLPLEVRGPQDFESAFSGMTRDRADALMVTMDWDLGVPAVRRLVEFAAQNRLPAIYSWRGFVEAGGLMSYGTSVPDLFRGAAAYADKILKGAKPAELPVQQPTKFELVVNLKTAKVLGLTIPQSVLIRANELIE